MEFPGRGIKPAGLFREVEKYWKDFRGRNFFEFWNFFFKMVRLDYSEEIDYSEWEIMKRKKFFRVLELLLENDAFRFREIDYGTRGNEEKIKIKCICNDREAINIYTRKRDHVLRVGRIFKKKKITFLPEMLRHTRFEFSIFGLSTSLRGIIHRRIGEYRYRSILRNIRIQYLET